MARGSVTPGGAETTVYETPTGSGDGHLDCVVDLGNMQSGDTVVVKVHRKSNGTNYRVLDEYTFTGAQTFAEWSTSRVWCNDNLRVKVTIQQTAGTNRSFSWEARVRA